MTKINNESWLITIDCDGTLIGDKLGDDMASVDIGKLFIPVYKALSKLGHKVCLNTGRIWDLCEPIYNKLGMTEPLILMNGTHILIPKDDQIPKEANSFKYINKKIDASIIDEMINNKDWGEWIINASGMSPGETYQASINPSADTYGVLSKMKEHMSGMLEKMNIKLHDVKRIEGEHNSLSIMFADLPSVREKVENFLISKNISYRIYDEVSPPGVKWVEISPNGISKGSGLLEIAKYYGIDKQRTMAFGDGSNDIEQIQNANIGVAMKNSIDKVKKHADQITKYSNSEEGVAKHLIDFFDLDIKY